MSTSPALRVRDLYKVFGRRPHEAVRRLRDGADRSEVDGTAAVIGAAFDVQPGEIFVVMGLSGSGKSTLIRMLNGLLEASAGEVWVGENDLTAVSARRLRGIRRRRISMVFQHFALLPHRTVAENVAYGVEIQGVRRVERAQRAQQMIEMVGLQDWGEKLPAQLSGGMQQRVGLARALATDTDILLMDEAFSALDPLIRREMQDQLLELQSTLGKTIVFITHDLNEAMHLGDRIAVMRDGRIVQIGSPEEILLAPADDYVEQFVADVDRARVLTAGSVLQSVQARVSLTAGPGSALSVMRERRCTSAIVLDPDGRLLGAVEIDDVRTLAQRGGSDLAEVLLTDVDTVTSQTVLADLVAPAVRSDRPLPVVDEDRRLLGVVSQTALLAAFGQRPATAAESPPESPDPSSTRPVDEPEDGLSHESTEASTDASRKQDTTGIAGPTTTGVLR